ncbi:MAG: nucleotide exchange factor GrpE [Thermoplasmatota archaeon]
MNPDDDFEFELDEDEEEEEFEKAKKKKSGKGPKKKSTTKPKKTGAVNKKKGTKEKSSKPSKAPKPEKPPKKSVEKTAKRNPIPDGVKRRLALNMREISKLRREIDEYKDEKETIEHELEMLEDEIDSLRSEKEKIEDEINKQIALANAYEKKLNRNQKDFDNFKKRTQNEVDRKAKLGSKKIYLGIIDVLDNFDRAISEEKKMTQTPEVEKIISGVESIQKGLLRVLHDNGVDVLDPHLEAFDPHYHEAIETRTDTSIPDNTVMEVESKGYLMGEIILRPAKVYVSKGGKPRPKKSKRSESKEEKDEEDEEVEDMDEIEDIEEMDDDLEEVEELDTD